MLLDGFQPTQININTDSESCRHSLGKLSQDTMEAPDVM